MDSSPTGPRTAPMRGPLFVIFLTVFIDLLGFGMVLPLLAIYAKAFDVDASGWELGLLVSSFSIMQFLFAPVWGRVSDRIGRRPVILIGLAGSVVFYTVFGIAAAMRSLTGLFVARIGAGVSGATIATAQAYIADTTDAKNRARGMALIGAAFGLGFTFGPLLAAGAVLWTPRGASLAESPWPGYLAASLSGIAFVFALMKLPETHKSGTKMAHRHWFDTASLKTALAIPSIGALLLTSFVAVLSFANFEGVLSLVLKNPEKQGGFGFPLTKVLLLFALLGFVHALGQGMVRGFAKRMSETKMASGGAIVSVLGFVLLAWAVKIDCFWLLVGGMVVEGIGFAFIPPSVQSMISRRSDPDKQGGILGVGQSLGALARILGHTICFPLLKLDPRGPFVAGAVLMAVALVVVATAGGRGRDFVVEEAGEG